LDHIAAIDPEDQMSELITPEEIVERVGAWRDMDVSYEILHGGLANRSYSVRVAGPDGEQRYVMKALTQAMGDFNLMIPIADVCRNTAAAGESGVGAKVVYAPADIPALVLEWIEGITLATADLSTAENIPRLGRSIAALHQRSPRFGNEIHIWKFLDDYLDLVEKHTLSTPDGIMDYLGTIREVQGALAKQALADVPSHNDLLPLNIMDDGDIRLIDYDFSGMNDPAFDLGDLAMEGDYDPDQVATLCESYFGFHDPVQTARARLFGIAAQYTWSLLFVGMHHLLPEAPAEDFDYFAEAESRWLWTKEKLEAADIGVVMKQAAGEGK
jgi:thiamine kinase-like enzyme